MKPKSPKSSSGKHVADPRQAVVDAALRQAAARDWINVGLSDIALDAGIGMGELARMFGGREDILAAYARRLDGDVLESVGDAPAQAGSARDGLFDILMERFDRMNRDRAAVKSIIGSVRGDPKQLVIALPDLGRSMVWMLEACGLETVGWRGALRVAGLSAIYARALYAWLDDDSADLSKVMAVLDQTLARGERVAEMLGL